MCLVFIERNILCLEIVWGLKNDIGYLITLSAKLWILSNRQTYVFLYLAIFF